MLMLTLETFVLLLIAGGIGFFAGRLSSTSTGLGGADWSTDQPWLRDGRAVPPAPLLPTPPTLLADDERARLAAAIAESARTHAAAVAAPAPIVAVPPQPEPVVVAPDPAPLVAAPPIAAVAPPPAAVAPVPVDLPPMTAEETARAAEADAVGHRPQALAAPVSGEADDLKRIKGIGPQNERRLHALGVFHFSQIAAWTPENARWAGSFLAFPGRIEREDWISQAKVLATGAATDFAKRVDSGDVPTSRSDGH